MCVAISEICRPTRKVAAGRRRGGPFCLCRITSLVHHFQATHAPKASCTPTLSALYTAWSDQESVSGHGSSIVGEVIGVSQIHSANFVQCFTLPRTVLVFIFDALLDRSLLHCLERESPNCRSQVFLSPSYVDIAQSRNLWSGGIRSERRGSRQKSNNIACTRTSVLQIL